MRDYFASCYRQHAVKVSDSSCHGGGREASSSVQSSVSCLYRSRLSTQKELLIRVTWFKSLVGQGLTVGIEDHQQLLKRKKGSRSFSSGDSSIVVDWDTSSARYDQGPEPVEGFYVVVVADAELGLLLGDMSRDHVVKSFSSESILIPAVADFSMASRTEEVLCSSGGAFSTKSRWFRDDGRGHDISITCRGPNNGNKKKDSGELTVCIDEKNKKNNNNNNMVVHVSRLKWNFRGNQTIFVDGLPVDVMWDVHDWWFGSSGDSRRAVFMLRARSGLERRLWLEEELLQKEQQGKKHGFCLLVHAIKSPINE